MALELWVYTDLVVYGGSQPLNPSAKICRDSVDLPGYLVLPLRSRLHQCQVAVEAETQCTVLQLACEADLATFSITPSPQRQLILNLAEMWMCLIFH